MRQHRRTLTNTYIAVVSKVGAVPDAAVIAAVIAATVVTMGSSIETTFQSVQSSL